MKQMKRPIGIAGFKGSGKDTLADLMLKYNKGFKKYSMADPIRKMGKVFHFSINEMLNPKMKEVENKFWGISWRKFAQMTGTDLFRHNFRDDVWVRFAEYAITKTNKNLIIPDIRFNNEAELIKKYGGIVIKVRREGCNGDSHASERGVDDKYVDIFVDNDGSIKAMKKKVEKILKQYGG